MAKQRWCNDRWNCGGSTIILIIVEARLQCVLNGQLVVSVDKVSVRHTNMSIVVALMNDGTDLVSAMVKV
jgi:hypothetical protein